MNLHHSPQHHSTTVPSTTAPQSPAPPPPPASPSSLPNEQGNEEATEQRKTLYVGDSIGGNVDIEALEYSTGTEFTAVKAYSAVHDTESNKVKHPARYPKKNFTDVISTKLKNGKFENMIIQSGSVDISNLDTKMNPEKHFDYFRQVTILSAKNIFSACENALVINPGLKKVIIMKQIPRYDRTDIDPLSIKQALSQIFNSSLTDLWLASPNKNKIFVGNHNLECSGGIRVSRYRNIQTGAWDRIHLFGSSGMKFYTKSVLNILKQAGLVETDYEHKSCFQTNHHSKQKGFKGTTWPFVTDVRRTPVPVRNRFAGLADAIPENY